MRVLIFEELIKRDKNGRIISRIQSCEELQLDMEKIMKLIKEEKDE